MEVSMRFMLAELIALTLLFILERLLQHLLNSQKKPYKAVNANDPSLISVYIYRIRKYGRRYVEYRFRNENGSWKPVIDKNTIIGITVVLLIMFGIIVYLVGVRDFLFMALPVALFAVALVVTRHVEAYRVLMKN